MLELQIVGSLAYFTIFLFVSVGLLVGIEMSKPVFTDSESVQ